MSKRLQVGNQKGQALSSRVLLTITSKQIFSHLSILYWWWGPRHIYLAGTNGLKNWRADSSWRHFRNGDGIGFAGTAAAIGGGED